MWIACINVSHDASVSLMKDDELIFHHREERSTHIKTSPTVFYGIDKIKDYTDTIDYLIYTSLNNLTSSSMGEYDFYCSKIGIHISYKIELDEHHLLHALSGIISSPFDKGVVVILDGAGTDLDLQHKENETIMSFSNDGDFKIKTLYKSCLGFKTGKVNILGEEINSTIGIGFMYNSVTQYLGYDCGEEGKTMGLSSYGKNTSNIHNLMVGDSASESIFSRDIHPTKGPLCIRPVSKYAFYKIKPKVTEENVFQLSANLALKAQQELEEHVFNMVSKALEISGEKNVVLSGGCFMNCVSNYRLLKKLPKDINVWVDPIANDAGISMGGVCAHHAIYSNDEKKFLPKRIFPRYLGSHLTYDYSLKENQKERSTSPKEIVDLLVQGNIVAIAQGRAESGARALGNRSILFDPRIKNGKEIVNRVKKREWWRPFAGTVMLEYAREWFDLDRLEESPYMCYAVDVLPDKRELIPSITHVDGTCRVQTVTQEQNKHYYDLISEFNNLTGVPILFNTSFNLAGDTIVETMQDALKTLEDSEIEYLYLPDIMKLIHVPNK